MILHLRMYVMCSSVKSVLIEAILFILYFCMLLIFQILLMMDYYLWEGVIV